MWLVSKTRGLSLKSTWPVPYPAAISPNSAFWPTQRRVVKVGTDRAWSARTLGPGQRRVNVALAGALADPELEAVMEQPPAKMAFIGELPKSDHPWGIEVSPGGQVLLTNPDHESRLVKGETLEIIGTENLPRPKN